MTPNSLLLLTRLAGLPDPDPALVDVIATDPVFPTRYCIAQAGASAIAATGVAAASLWEVRTGQRQRIAVNGRAAAAALRSNQYLKVDGVRPAGVRDGVTGFYPVKHGRWIYLHCNFPNLRARNLAVLAAAEDRESVTERAAQWDGQALEDAIFAAGGCGALVRSEQEWNATAQAAAVAQTPLIEIVRIGDAPPEPLPPGDRPLSGIRVLDLTRVLAGPTGARALAEHGADILKIARPDLPDSGMFDLDTGTGKLSAFLDFRQPSQAGTLRQLIRDGDVFLQSYRPGALASHGYGPQDLAALRSGIVYVTLSAWGHTGPWANRRGYDTVVQAANGMAFNGPDAKPTLQPASPQDYVAGYLLAYGTMVALARRAQQGGSWMVRLSLAGAGQWIKSLGAADPAQGVAELPAEELQSYLMQSPSPSGQLTHLAPVVQMSATPPRWDRPAVPLGTHEPAWPRRA
ncbi:CoA transferase [Acidisphaera sp. L21]|uniref:CoA transferase n=1 Tax=Acidisphaera sp. L21 TaxID=1641851 RepID=UPI00131CB7E1|nr:CoA transferase [Acidisphaera sp. L21]